jgi:phosphopantothenoylcysteine decarboxylase/phosphopantothenate--cysteine ligase
MHFKDRKIIITGGPTREWLDPVRFISNPSTGKMGIALADEAFRRGGETVFIHGPIDMQLVEDKPYRTVKVESTGDMLRAVMDEIRDYGLLIMSAAPADYTAASPSATKIKKTEDELTLTLKKTPDILKNVAVKRQEGGLDHLFVVGFAAETDNVEEYALGKLKSKNLDMICLNDVSRKGAGFGTETNIIVIFNRDGVRIKLPILSKADVAVKIFDRIETQLSH